MEPIWYPSKIEFFFSISLVTIQYQNWLLCRKKRSKLGRIQIRVVFKGRIRIRFFLGGKIRIRFFFKDRIWIRISLSKVGSGWTLTGSRSNFREKNPNPDPIFKKKGSGSYLREKTGSWSDPWKQPGSGSYLILT